MLVNYLVAICFIVFSHAKHTQFSDDRKKVQNLSLGRYLFKRYNFVTYSSLKGAYWYHTATNMYTLGTNMYLTVREKNIWSPADFVRLPTAK